MVQAAVNAKQLSDVCTNYGPPPLNIDTNCIRTEIGTPIGSGLKGDVILLINVTIFYIYFHSMFLEIR